METPAGQAGKVLIRSSYTGVSVGTEFALVRNKISWGPARNRQSDGG